MQRAGDLDPAPLTTRQRQRRRAPQMGDREFGHQLVEHGLAPLQDRLDHFQNGAHIVFHGHAPEDRGFLGQIANAQARALAERDGVRFKYFDIIYDLLDDIKGEMAGVLGPERIETVVGRAEIKEIFPAGKKDKAAGLLVTDGFIRKGLYARITRDDVIVSKTSIASLRRFKDDVAEVRAGLECGVVLQDTNDIKPGDILETFDVEMRDRTL